MNYRSLEWANINKMNEIRSLYEKINHLERVLELADPNGFIQKLMLKPYPK